MNVEEPIPMLEERKGTFRQTVDWLKSILPNSSTKWLSLGWTVGLFAGGVVIIYNFEAVKDFVGNEGFDDPTAPRSSRNTAAGSGP
ncbi:hypothetical protein AAMO2058_000596300 [Amorphochlora amoebiformis]|eukprot:1201415-Amorphochlora_amoeboformis.AAC.1